MISERQATVCGLLALFFWSTTIAFARSIVEQLGALTAACCIYGLGAVFSSVAFYLRNGVFPFRLRFQLSYLIPCGALFILYMVSLYVAIGLASDRTQLLEIGLINYLWPILTVLFSIPLLKQRASGLIFLGCSSALIGMVLITTQRGVLSFESFFDNLSSNPVAYLLALLAAVTWALYSNLSRILGRDQPNGAVVLFMLATALSLLILRSWSQEVSEWNVSTALEVGYMSFAATMGYVCWDIGVRNGNFSILSTSSYLVPLLSTIIACLYLRASSGPKLWVGCILIVLGAYLSKRSLSSEKPPSQIKGT